MRLHVRYADWYRRQPDELRVLVGIVLPVLSLAAADWQKPHHQTLGVALYLLAGFLAVGSFASWMNMCFFFTVPEREPVCEHCGGRGYQVNLKLRVLEDCVCYQAEDAAPSESEGGPRQRPSALAERLV